MISMKNNNFLNCNYMSDALRRRLNYIRLVLTDKEHKYLKCSICKKALRVPRGQGTISVNCPYCKGKTRTKS